ncbi:MAG: glycosyl hydrolase [Bacteroidota bacterium]
MRKPFTLLILLFSTIMFLSHSAIAQMEESTFKGMAFRSIGPAFSSGRIADIAIHPQDENVWYVAVASGGVWKTVNAGTTWKPIFDDQAVYSTGCVTIDPNNPSTVWVGTGENVGGRHIGFGDGIYRSEDGGMSWTNMGLPKSEHISKIIIHPDNSDVMWVAVQGPLWSSGGERGVFMSTDGGENWTQTLGDDEWVGATDLAIDPRDPMTLYAATWQRHRTVAAYMGGGPGTGLHKSTDGGKSWKELTSGLPKSNMGKIGLAISPINPDVLYAAIELDRRTGGVYKSTDKGETWKKQSSAVSGATGPHYYQELYASPHAFDRIYLVDVRIQVSDDGGKTFRRLKEEHKHSDNHAIVFKADDPDYLLIGTDGGIYESFDLAENWRFINNLPLTQYYKLAVDDAEPFYNIYGGTQDVNTHGGPSRTDNLHGIRNADWYITLFADGHQPATEPGNPDIVYCEWQQGNLTRVDRTTGEIVYIQPQPAEGEPYERFNWDAPILVSPHKPTRLYFASQRVWRSEDRGDSWTAISGDLTKDEERITLPIMGKQQSWDNSWDMLAMSNYNTITSLAESPQQEGLVYAGTDDGIIQVTEDGGTNWRRIDVGSLPGVPDLAFVNDIKADMFDASTAYVCLDNHKYGDYKPYFLKTTDKGRSWTSMTDGLPEKTLVWRFVQDHVKKDLMFLATEFGIYFTVNGGNDWTKLSGGVPTIPFRDLAIQKRENDLVGASFGRSFYVLDDYAPLREVNQDQMEEEATLFAVRKAWWYIPRGILSFNNSRGNQGASHYVAPNPPFGAVFTYYLKDGLTTTAAERKKAEKELAKDGKDISFPGWDAVEAERNASKPKIWFTVKDSDGNLVRKLTGPTSKGFHRISWDLKYPQGNFISPNDKTSLDKASGLMAAPGTYTVSLSKEVDGVITDLSDAVEFEVVPLRKGALEGSSPAETAAFWRELESTSKDASVLRAQFGNQMKKLGLLKTSLERSLISPGDMNTQLHELTGEYQALRRQLFGYRSKSQVGQKNDPTINNRLGMVFNAVSNSTYGPTPSAKASLEMAQKEVRSMKSSLKTLSDKMASLQADMEKAGAPAIE